MTRTPLHAVVDKLISHDASKGMGQGASAAEMRHQGLALKLQWGLGLLSALIISPYLYLALQGVLGVLALAVAGTLGMATIQLAPVLSLKLANLRVRLMRDEVQAHPLDVLENEQLQRHAALDRAYVELSEAMAALAEFEEALAQHGCTHPEDNTILVSQRDQSHRLVLQLEAGLSQAELDLAAFGQQVARARSIWKLAKSQQRLARAIGQAQGGAQTQWQTDTALEATRNAMNRSFAQLDSVMKRRALEDLRRKPNAQAI